MRPSSVIKRLGYVALAIVALAGFAQAQTGRGTITGVVTDATTKTPLAAAQVAVQGGGGAQTGADGRFTIANVPAGNYTLVVQRVGASPQTFPGIRVEAGQTVTKNIELQQQALRMQGLISTGVSDPTAGTKSPLSVAHLDMADIPVASASAASPLAALKGKVAGLQIQTTGNPGQETTNIQLRSPASVNGSTTPMIIVDGLVLLNGSLNDIEAQDIDNIEIVKGAAAAALYGSKAAAGVISIRTNRGRDIAQGTTRLSGRTEAGAEVLGKQITIAQHHAFLVDANGNYIDYNGNLVPRVSRVADSTGFMDNNYGAQTYNHIDQTFGTGTTGIANLRLGYNSASTNFNSTVAGTRQTGVLKIAKGTDKYDVRLNVDHRIGDKINLSLGAYANTGFTDRAQGGTNVYNNAIRLGPEIDLLAVRPGYDPNLSPISERYVINPDILQDTTKNPFAVNAYTDTWQKKSGLQSTFDGTYRLTSYFNLSGIFGYQRTYNNEKVYITTGTITSSNPLTGAVQKSTGQHIEVANWNESVNGELSGNFIEGFGDLTARASLRVIGQVSNQTQMGVQGDSITVRRSQRLGDAQLFSINNTTGQAAPTYLKERDKVLTVALDYASRYTLEGLIRQDQNSAFGKNTRSKFSTRASAGWRLTDEAWWPWAPINLFKLRYSIGTAGTPPGASLQYDRFGFESERITRTTIGNTHLRPENVVEQEMGFDMALNNKYSLEVTHSRRKTKDLTQSENIVAYIGFDNQQENIGDLQGRSWEGTLEANWVSGRQFRWNTVFTASRDRTYLSKWRAFAGCSTTSRTVSNWTCVGTTYGEQFGNFLVRNKTDLRTVHQTNNTLDQFDVNDDGLVVAVGPNGSWQDGKWNSLVTIDGIQYKWGMPILKTYADTPNTLVFGKYGQALPVALLGMQNTLVYGNWTLYTSFIGQPNGHAYNQQHRDLMNNSLAREMDQAGKPDYQKKPIAYYNATPSAPAGLSNLNSGISGGTSNNVNIDYFFEKDSYLKLDNLSLTYNMRQLPRVLRRVPAKNGSLSLIGRNVLSISPFSGSDPEATGSNVSDRVANNAYPTTRTVTFAVSLTF